MDVKLIPYLIIGATIVIGVLLVRLQYNRDRNNFLILAKKIGGQLLDADVTPSDSLFITQPKLTVNARYKGYFFNISLVDKGKHGGHGYHIGATADKKLSSMRINRKYIGGDGVDYYALKEGVLPFKEVDVNGRKILIKTTNTNMLNDIIERKDIISAIGLITAYCIGVFVGENKISLVKQGIKRLMPEQIIAIMDAMVLLANFVGEYPVTTSSEKDPILHPKMVNPFKIIIIVIILFAIFFYVMLLNK